MGHQSGWRHEPGSYNACPNEAVTSFLSSQALCVKFSVLFGEIGFGCMLFPDHSAPETAGESSRGTGFYSFSLPRGGRAEYGSQI